MDETLGESGIDRISRYGLSIRDLLVLRYIAEGMSDAEIASAMGVATHEAEGHVSVIVKKMTAPSRHEAAIRALREGLISPS